MAEATKDSLETYLQIENLEKNLSGLSQIFDDNSNEEINIDETKTHKESVNMNMDPFTLHLNDHMNFSLIQSHSAFGEGTGNDETGNVLWGASVHLSKWLTEISLTASSTLDRQRIRSDSRVKKKGIIQSLSNLNSNLNCISIQNKSILELGCGTALNSLVASRLDAGFIMATDYEDDILAHAKHHVDLNNKQESDELNMNICVQKLDWYDIMERSCEIKEENNRNTSNYSLHETFSSWFDANANSIQIPYNSDYWKSHLLEYNGFQIIMASDVIYGTHMVLPLVTTIDAFLMKNKLISNNSDCLNDDDEHGIVIIATRDGRRGIEEFRQAMKQKGNFKEIYVHHIPGKSHKNDNENNAITRNKVMENSNVPECFKGEANIGRWKANHTIYVYQRL